VCVCVSECVCVCVRVCECACVYVYASLISHLLSQQKSGLSVKKAQALLLRLLIAFTTLLQQNQASARQIADFTTATTYCYCYNYYYEIRHQREKSQTLLLLLITTTTLLF